MRRWWCLVMAMIGLAGCTTEPTPANPDPPSGPERLRVEVLATYPHDPAAFTQGLELHDGTLYEGTGQYGQSELRIVAVESGEVERSVALPDDTFGEGITVVGDQVWQLTWQEGFAFRRDRDTLAEIDRVSYSGEGWGLCYDQALDRLVMSDGSAELTFRDPDTFEPTGTVSVTRAGEPLTMLNELECVAGQVWANVWLTDEIVRIAPESGQVEAVVDATGLLDDSAPDGEGMVDVLNGIAAIPDTDTFLITGKLWPALFQVRFVPAGPPQ